ncbi:hypothetical protein SARC_09627, partial [Sphaeroforma arctica JP610]
HDYARICALATVHISVQTQLRMHLYNHNFGNTSTNNSAHTSVYPCQGDAGLMTDGNKHQSDFVCKFYDSEEGLSTNTRWIYGQNPTTPADETRFYASSTYKQWGDVIENLPCYINTYRYKRQHC